MQAICPIYGLHEDIGLIVDVELRWEAWVYSLVASILKRT